MYLPATEVLNHSGFFSTANRIIERGGKIRTHYSLSKLSTESWCAEKDQIGLAVAKSDSTLTHRSRNCQVMADRYES